MKAIGIESGIGSMLISARNAGFEILGNIESRKQFYSGTYEKNFPESLPLSKKCIPTKEKIHLMMCHPKCGKFSSMGWANSGGRRDLTNEQSTFPLVKEAIQYYKPEFFVIDNLPRALIGSPLIWWAKGLEDYRLGIEYVSNYGYGNSQKTRQRVFILGWKKEYQYAFIPGEFEHNKTTEKVIHDLIWKEIPEINHELFPKSMKAPNMLPLTVAEAIEFFKDFPEATNPLYIKDSYGNTTYVKFKDMKRLESMSKRRIGTKKMRWKEHSQVITSGRNLYHPIRNDPMTCRERARIQGFPDDFVFVLKGNDRFNSVMGSQTGQAVPIEFTTYLSNQIMSYLRREDYKDKTGIRTSSNKLVEDSKKEYCREYGKRTVECIHCVCSGECG